MVPRVAGAVAAGATAVTITPFTIAGAAATEAAAVAEEHADNIISFSDLHRCELTPDAN